MRASRSFLCFTLLVLGLSTSVWFTPAHAGNVRWTMGDSLVTVCPGGDSVVAGHPAILRLAVNYADASGNAKVGVPPDSIWVTLKATGTGTIVLSDATDAGDDFEWKVLADDSTGTAGLTRFSLFGFSGCGDLYVRLYVAGVSQGTRTARVRSLDADLHDPVEVDGDSAFACDWDYSGGITSADYALLHAHADHGHRNALHGTLVRRTNACGSCGQTATGVLGASEVSWSPDGRQIAYTQFIGEYADCSVFTIPSDPAHGDTPIQRTSPPDNVHDYDPEWSPLGGAMAFDRDDRTIYHLDAGTGGLSIITESDDGGEFHRGDVMPAISPNGQWVAFARKSPSGPFELYKIPIRGTPGGASATQLTSLQAGNDFYPQWSPDGAWILFERTDPSTERRTTYIMRADSAGSERALLIPTGGMAVTPAFSRDGAILMTGAGLGGPSDAVLNVHTMAGNLPAQGDLAKTVANYTAFELTGNTDSAEGAFAVMSPRSSPDGTRIAVRASPPEAPTERPQLWASRRNMSRPPTVDAVGGEAVIDSVPVLDFDAEVGTPFTLVVEASDPEGDQLTYRAYFLRGDLGMSFDDYTQTFSWTPPQNVDFANPYHVRFQVETTSGGTDYAVARILVHAASGGGGGSGCPTLSTYTPRGWRTENTLLGRSKDGRYLVDAYKLREHPARVRDRYRLEIRETEQERTTLDQVRLLAVDHDPKLQAFASESGVWLGERRAAHRVWNAAGQDLTPRLHDGSLLGGSPGDFLIVEMDDPEQEPGIRHQDPGLFDDPPGEKERPGSLKPEGAVAASAVDALILEGSGFTVHGADAEGHWNALTSFYPREWGGETLVENAGSGRVKIAFKGRQHLSFIGKLAGATPVTPEELPLELARHSVKKDVAEALASVGGKVTTLDPGETLSLEFAAPPVPSGQVRDLFLVSRGLYTAFVSGATPVGLPVRFALGQSQPNPASGSALIRFELPVKAKVKLEVFDLLGRRVQVLADREFEAGYQSVEWNGKDRSGQAVGAGVYLYRMTAPGFRDQKKMTVLP